MRFLAIGRRSGKMLASAVIPLLALFQGGRLHAEQPKTQYPAMLPIEQYLMNRADEIALARSAAPEAISRDATILVLGRHGYETAIQGKNGFVCMVERGWVGAFDWPEAWNPKIRGADCLNAPAAQAILPIANMRTEMAIEGRPTKDIVTSVRHALQKGKLPPLAPGAMSYMMAKSSYLTDEDGHNGPHLMFYVPLADPAAWGAGVPGSPVGSASYWFVSEKTSHELIGFPPIRIFTIEVATWSDGTPASMEQK